METIIKTEGLCKSYGTVKAVQDLSLNVYKGEIYGFLGLNGAGKTTTIRMLLGLINPDSGSVYISGHKLERGKTGLWNNIGYLVEVPYSYPELTVRENLEIVRRLRMIQDHKAVDNIIEKMSLSSYTHRKARNLSLGNKQRLGLAKALIHNPDILILDEPSNGLDPAGIIEIRELLTGLAKELGVTVFISSHILGEISKFATRIGIIHNGKLIQELNSAQLESNCRKTIRVELNNSNKTEFSIEGKSFEISKFTDNLLDISYEEELESYFLNCIKSHE